MVLHLFPDDAIQATGPSGRFDAQHQIDAILRPFHAKLLRRQ